MGQKGFTPESAKAAGEKSRRGRNKINPNLKKYIENEGSDKLLEEMKKLKGGQYVDAWVKIAPYLYHKLSAIEVEGDTGININVRTPGKSNE